jgi:DNA-binding NtrC family response regulator
LLGRREIVPPNRGRDKVRLDCLQTIDSSPVTAALVAPPARLAKRFGGGLAGFRGNVALSGSSNGDRTMTSQTSCLLDAPCDAAPFLAAPFDACRTDGAAARASRLDARVRALTEETDPRTGDPFVVGGSPAWRRVLRQATQVASTNTTALLLGESGTGKEVVARFLHRASSRRNGPFVALNCAALPEHLLEAELFGYERGAFTGATQSKPGQLEQAAGGTLFLDEVGEMSPSAQAKFLRVLQEREFQRLGGTRVLRADVRIVAATNRDLPRAMASGQFREDLYYRLNVFTIQLPALRDRRDDIRPLSDAFLETTGRELAHPPAGVSRDALDALMAYHWPGNVRELRNVIECAAILCDGGPITPEHLALTGPAPLTAPAPAAPVAASVVPPQSGDLQAMERAMIEQALQSARFNKSKAAKAIGLTRRQLYCRMRKYGFMEWSGPAPLTAVAHDR